MSDTRKLTVGVTINLGNSESLHLEVSDTAETEYDAAELRGYLASVLDGYGANDTAVRQAIAGYRHRVLAEKDTEYPAVESSEEISMDMFSSFVPGEDAESSHEIEFIPEKEPASVFDDAEEVREEIAEDDYLRLPPAPLVEESAEEFVCSKCGATVSKLQRDVSMLFNHKILCKDCMK